MLGGLFIGIPSWMLCKLVNRLPLGGRLHQVLAFVGGWQEHERERGCGVDVLHRHRWRLSKSTRRWRLHAREFWQAWNSSHCFIFIPVRELEWRLNGGYLPPVCNSFPSFDKSVHAKWGNNYVFALGSAQITWMFTTTVRFFSAEVGPNFRKRVMMMWVCTYLPIFVFRRRKNSGYACLFDTTVI